MLNTDQKEKFNTALNEFAVWNGSPFDKNADLQVLETMNFKSDIGFDSLDEIEFLMEIEKLFKCSIPDEKALTVKTVGDAYNVLGDCIVRHPSNSN